MEEQNMDTRPAKHKTYRTACFNCQLRIFQLLNVWYLVWIQFWMCTDKNRVSLVLTVYQEPPAPPCMDAHRNCHCWQENSIVQNLFSAYGAQSCLFVCGYFLIKLALYVLTKPWNPEGKKQQRERKIISSRYEMHLCPHLLKHKDILQQSLFGILSWWIGLKLA